jgi:hypothetical protein
MRDAGGTEVGGEEERHTTFSRILALKKSIAATTSVIAQTAVAA